MATLRCVCVSRRCTWTTMRTWDGRTGTRRRREVEGRRKRRRME
jgi:hypothetical protein